MFADQHHINTVAVKLTFRSKSEIKYVNRKQSEKFLQANSQSIVSKWVSEQCFTSPPTQYGLYGRRFLQVKRPNQQYQSTEGDATKYKENNENN